MRKRFGQHFLRDPEVLGRMVQTMHLHPEDSVMEIGPGRGALTEHLLQVLNTPLRAVEIDRDLCADLSSRWSDEQLLLECGDVLEYPWDTLPLETLRVVGNLPYNISTPLMVHLFNQPIRDMHFLLQEEVVDRLVAQPGGGNYGRLTLVTQLYGKAEKLLEVPPECFTPRPKVNSALVRISRHEQPIALQHPEVFSHLVKRAFSQRRKMLRRSLGNAEVISEAGVDPCARPEQLSLDDFIRLSTAYAAHGKEN